MRAQTHLGTVEQMVLAVDDLSRSGLEWGEREEDPPGVFLTDRDLKLMALLHDVNFLTARQLLMLGWGASQRRAGQRRLKELHDTGYLDRFRPVRAFGRAEWIYRVGAQGWRTLVDQCLVAGRRGYTPAVITSIGYAEHDLQLAALVLHLADKASRHSSGGLIERMPFSWQGPRSGRIDIDEGEDFERSAAAKLAPGTRLHVEQSRRGYLEPDATLIGGSGAERWAVLIEYDRTERPHKQIDRLRRYDWWLLEGWREAHFATHAIPPVVIYLTARSGPLRGLIEAADQTFSAWHGRRDAGPREGTHPARERVVFASRERVLAGDWTMERAPSLPPVLREYPNVCSPGSLVCDLPALFGRRGERAHFA
jgi:hypothetical protein